MVKWSIPVRQVDEIDVIRLPRIREALEDSIDVKKLK